MLRVVIRKARPREARVGGLDPLLVEEIHVHVDVPGKPAIRGEIRVPLESQVDRPPIRTSRVHRHAHRPVLHPFHHRQHRPTDRQPRLERSFGVKIEVSRLRLPVIPDYVPMRHTVRRIRPSVRAGQIVTRQILRDASYLVLSDQKESLLKRLREWIDFFWLGFRTIR